MAASVRARAAKQQFDQFAIANYGEAHGQRLIEIAAKPSTVLKAATAPAQTTIAG